VRFNLFKGNKVLITATNIRWRGSVHDLGKLSIKGKEFDLEIPFQNKPQQDYTLSYIKTKKMPPVTVNGIEIKEPFKLISVEPVPPSTINEGEKVIFKMKIGVPEFGYEGPLSIELKSDSSDLAHIEITKTIAIRNSKRTELPVKPMIIDIPKGQVFRQSVHLHGIVEFGEEIKSITAQAPFAFVSSDPTAPFTIDKKSGFLLDIYLQAPKASYGGPLEIVLD
jgi:hypothetical protein